MSISEVCGIPTVKDLKLTLALFARSMVNSVSTVMIQPSP